MDVTTLAQSLFLRDTIRKLQSDMLDAQWQQSTGKKSKTFSGVAGQSAMLLSLRNRVQGITQYQSSINATLTRTTVMQDALGAVASNGGKIAEFALSSKDLNPQMLARLPAQARTSLDESISMLNASVGDRFLFAGDKPTASPVAEAADILGGTGLAPLGLHDLVKDRMWADLSDNDDGWIQAAASINPNEIVLSKDVNFAFIEDFTEYGFSLNDITLTQGGVSTSGVRDNATYGGEIVSGNPGYDVRNTESLTLGLDPTLLADGDSIDIEFGMPAPADPIHITLKFTSDLLKAADDDDMMAIDAALNQATILSKLNDMIEKAAKEQLAPASAQRAADLMFDYQVDPTLNDASPVPRYMTKVNAPPLERPHMTYDSGPSSQVARWYTGQNWPQNTAQGLRDSAQAVIDHNVTISYGVRADESPIRDSIKHMAMLTLSADTFEAEDGYTAMVSDKGLKLGGNQTGVIQTRADIGLKEERMKTLLSRHEQTFTVVSQQVLDIEGADQFDIASRLLEYETRLKATYEISGRVHALSIVNFLR